LRRNLIHNITYLQDVLKRQQLNHGWSIWYRPPYKSYNTEIHQTFLNVDNVPEDTYELIKSKQNSSDIECLLAQQHTLLWNEDRYLEIVPGQNNRPLSVIYDEHAEDLSFPSIYFGQARTFKAKKVIPFIMTTISCIDMVFGRNVNNCVSCFSYLRPILSTTNHRTPQLTDVTTN
jgi:hypothetical protein